VRTEATLSADGAARLGPIVENPHRLALPDEATEVLCGLFPEHLRVVVDGELTGGFSGSRVFTVLPYRELDVPDLPAVVKLAPRDLIEAEAQAYRTHIQGRLSGVPEVRGEAVLAADRSWGGLCYALVGSGLFAVESLDTYCRRADLADIAHVLEGRLLVQLASLWRHGRAERRTNFDAAGYSTLLPGHGRPDVDVPAAVKRLSGLFADVLGTEVDLNAAMVWPPGRAESPLPNPLVALPALMAEPRQLAIAAIHGDLNLENVLVDPDARTVRLIDFAASREDHVLHDLLRLETGILTRLLPAALAADGLGPELTLDLLAGLQHKPGSAPPWPSLHRVHVMLVLVRRAAVELLIGPDGWRDYLDGLTVYLLGAGKFRNLDAAARAVAFWGAAGAQALARAAPVNEGALRTAVPQLLQRNPVLESYRLGRVAAWTDPRFALDERFVGLSLLVDQGEAAPTGRWQARPERFEELADVLAAVDDPALVLLGPPGSGKSTLLRHFELTQALLGLEEPTNPLTFFVPLQQYLRDPLGKRPAPMTWLAEGWGQRHPTLPPLGELLAEGRMVLLLDGLNEMPVASDAEHRAAVQGWKDFIQRLATELPRNRVVFSCRSLDYSAPLSTPALRVPQVQVEPLTDAQVQRFLQLYMPQRADAMWADLAGTPQLGLLRAPYFLGLLIDQVAAHGEIPQGRAALFTGFVRQALRRELERDNPLFQPGALLSERDVQRLAQARSWRHPWELPERGALIGGLGRLAHSMQRNLAGEAAQLRIGYDTALELAGEPGAQIVRAGLALAVLDEDLERDEVLFYHQLLQEYFAARRLALAPDPALVVAEWRAEGPGPALQVVLSEVAPADELPPLPSTGWEETTVLAAAMAPEPDAFVHGVMAVNLALAGRAAAVDEVRERLNAATLTELRLALVERTRDAGADLRHRLACGLALGNLGDPRLERRSGPQGAYLEPPMVDLSGGRYVLGAGAPLIVRGQETAAHCPAAPVQLAAFALGQRPVTNAEWASFMASGGYGDDRWWTTAEAGAWRRGEIGADRIHHQVRYWVDQFRAEPEQMAEHHRQGRWDDALLERWQRRVAMSDAELADHLWDMYPGGPLDAPAFWGDERYNNPAQPVVGISWYEARAYCAWLAAQSERPFRLPSEAEWEAATRGEAGRAYAYGERFDPTRCNTVETHLRRPTPVGVFPDGDTPEGIADLTGNLYEWTASLWGPDPESPAFRYPYVAGDGREDPAASADLYRVVRGGAWNYDQACAHAAIRVNALPDDRFANFGLRLALSLS
jgi:formylglycine-generating enzyme required for sulfatase activity